VPTDSSVPAQVKIRVPGNHLMTPLLGRRDELLQMVRDAFPAAVIHVRGNEISVDGAGAEAAGRVFEELVVMLEQGHATDNEVVARTIDMVRADERPSAVFGTTILRAPSGRTVRPKSAGQMAYAQAIRDNIITFGIGW
jgi:phosphate starvation-inducible protein PhoH and related proteins